MNVDDPVTVEDLLIVEYLVTVEDLVMLEGIVAAQDLDIHSSRYT